MRRLTLVILTVLTVTLGYACGSSNPAGPSSMNQTISDSVSGWTGGGNNPYKTHTISITKTGTMTATLSWGDTSVDLDIHMTDSSCSDWWTCTVLERSVDVAGTSERVSHPVTSGQTYKLFVDNYSTRSQSYTITINVP